MKDSRECRKLIGHILLTLIGISLFLFSGYNIHEAEAAKKSTVDKELTDEEISCQNARYIMG